MRTTLKGWSIAGRSRACLLLLAWIWSGQVGAVGEEASDETVAGAVALGPTKEWSGVLVCLPEEMHRIHGADLPREHEHVPGFRTEDHQYFLLLRTKLSEALFTDDRLKHRNLLLKGRVYPGTQILDVTLIRSIKDGVVQDLYYWCDICAIKSVVPEECMCCHQPVVLIEKPLE